MAQIYDKCKLIFQSHGDSMGVAWIRFSRDSKSQPNENDFFGPLKMVKWISSVPISRGATCHNS